MLPPTRPHPSLPRYCSQLGVVDVLVLFVDVLELVLVLVCVLFVDVLELEVVVVLVTTHVPQSLPVLPYLLHAGDPFGSCAPHVRSALHAASSAL